MKGEVENPKSEFSVLSAVQPPPFVLFVSFVVAPMSILGGHELAHLDCVATPIPAAPGGGMTQ